MAEDVTIREDLQVIQVKSYGDITAEDLKKTLDAIRGIRQRKGLTKVFVDATKVTSYPSTLSIFKFGSDAAASLMSIKLAIAAPPGAAHDPAFFETVTRNRGALVSVFDSPDAALAWLTKEPNKPDAGDG
jgi:hypothetical protein